MYLLGYDVGGTKIEAALFRFGHNGVKTASPATKTFQFQNRQGVLHDVALLATKRVPTERSLGYQQILDKLERLCRELCSQVGIQPADLASIGLGMPGSVHPLQQTMVKGSIFALFGKEVGQDLRVALNIDTKVLCENDGNCFALAEVLCGAGIEHFRKTHKPVGAQTAIGIILGTGCGGGFVVGGRVVRGKSGGAAEVGHTILYPEGAPCYCGRLGCSEQYVSGPALEAAFNQRIYSQIEGRPDARRIFELAEAEEPSAVAVLHQYRNHLARFLGNLACLLDPDYYVLGGGLSQQNLVYNGLAEMIQQRAFLSDIPIPVYRNTLGDSAGVIGAALLGLEE